MQDVQRLDEVARALVAVLRVADEEDAVRLLLHVVERAKGLGVDAVVDDLDVRGGDVEDPADGARRMLGAGDDAVDTLHDDVLHKEWVEDDPA